MHKVHAVLGFQKAHVTAAVIYSVINSAYFYIGTIQPFGSNTR